jgi:hypothetical protein
MVISLVASNPRSLSGEANINNQIIKNGILNDIFKFTPFKLYSALVNTSRYLVKANPLTEMQS